MNIRYLRYFMTVADTLSFTRAAEQLHIAQPALSIAVKKLEQELDITLFHRQERKVSLTYEGQVLLEHAHQIMQQIESARLAIDELKGLEKGEVRLGVPGMMGSYFFPDILMAFKTRYPNIKLRMVEAGTQSIRKMLVNGDLDLGVVVNRNVPDTLATEHLLNSEMVAVVSQVHRFSKKSSISFKEFFSEDLVMFREGYFHRELADEICQKYQLESKIAVETNLLPMILKIVEGNHAVSPLLKLVAQCEHQVSYVPFEDPVKLEIVMAWRKNSYLSLADQTFKEFVKEKCV
ncbi:LysR family transcriptional regulator [Endozoicomonas numazuensis]|uniref:LysR family transcriptional regulator n=1 Tax=Endozoicomonas numazuensis TaxID=1137799 RepID=A0A081NFA0_9GAMM|nr:LysR family transcriptional regulator [Endozoicomonas numazuensis]KEQ17123.1 LysR family transcriptional regulator [Endozoicomonas numazuensis]